MRVCASSRRHCVCLACGIQEDVHLLEISEDKPGGVNSFQTYRIINSSDGVRAPPRSQDMMGVMSVCMKGREGEGERARARASRGRNDGGPYVCYNDVCEGL